MPRRASFLLALAFGVVACAPGPPPEPPAPPPLDPTGTFDLTISAQGAEIPGVMTISGSMDDGYTGDIDTEMGAAGITQITVDGQTLTFYIPDADVSATVSFDGDTFTGGFTGAMGEAVLTGVRRGRG